MEKQVFNLAIAAALFQVADSEAPNQEAHDLLTGETTIGARAVDGAVGFAGLAAGDAALTLGLVREAWETMSGLASAGLVAREFLSRRATIGELRQAVKAAGCGCTDGAAVVQTAAGCPICGGPLGRGPRFIDEDGAEWWNLTCSSCGHGFSMTSDRNPE